MGVELREKALDLAHSAMATMSANPECACGRILRFIVLSDCVLYVWCTGIPLQHVGVCLRALD